MKIQSALLSTIIGSNLLLGCGTSDAREITGKLWALDRYTDSEGVTSSDRFRFSLNFHSNGNVEGFYLCNGYGGSYLLKENVITFTDVIIETAGCSVANKPTANIFARLFLSGSRSTSMIIEHLADNTLSITSREKVNLVFKSE